MRVTPFLRLPAALGLLLLFSAHRVAPALTIQFRFGDRFEEGSPQRQAIEWAADRWEARLQDPVAATINVEFDDLTGFDGNVLGVSWPLRLEIPYIDVRAALVDDVSTTDDQTATSHLPPGPDLAFCTWDPQGMVITSAGSDTINRTLSLTAANAKALRLPVIDDPEQLDGTIRFNERLLAEIRTDFDPSNGVRGYDFVALAAHEIGHVLGITSGVSIVDEATLPNGPNAPRDLREQSVLATWDLFRYSSESLPLLDLAPGGSPYFSIDGGATALASLTSGEFNGDGFHPAHWTPGHGLMDPVLPKFEVVPIEPLDLLALDVIGWDLVVVPEPASTVLLLGAVGLLGWRARPSIRGGEK